MIGRARCVYAFESTNEVELNLMVYSHLLAFLSLYPATLLCNKHHAEIRIGKWWWSFQSFENGVKVGPELGDNVMRLE